MLLALAADQHAYQDQVESESKYSVKMNQAGHNANRQNVPCHGSSGFPCFAYNARHRSWNQPLNAKPEPPAWHAPVVSSDRNRLQPVARQISRQTTGKQCDAILSCSTWASDYVSEHEKTMKLHILSALNIHSTRRLQMANKPGCPAERPIICNN